MGLALPTYLFLAAASVKALSTTGDVWNDVNITTMVLQVAGAISTTCNANANCTQLTTVEVWAFRHSAALCIIFASYS